MNKDDVAGLVERTIEQAEQKAAACRHLYGLPVIVTESDTQKGKSALWMDNGMAGCGQVAISTGEFPCEQTDAIGALVNIAAATDYASIADALTTLSARVETLEAQQLSVLTGFYLKQPAAVAEICDTVLDRSGALLGRVRDHAAEVKSSQALAGDDHGHR